MNPEENGYGASPSRDADDGPRPSPAAPGGRDGQCVSATDLLVELAQCQRSIRSLVRSAIGGLVPVSSQTLPGVAFTLGGLIRATEMAANTILDHAEALAADRERLAKALAQLEPLVDTRTAPGREAWLEVVDSTRPLAGRVMSIMSATAFQDLTTQQLTGAIRSVEQVRGQLIEILQILDLPVETPDPAGEAAERGRPAFRFQSRQAVADRLWAELKGR